MEYKVLGLVFSHIGELTIEADSYEEAMDKAAKEFGEREGKEDDPIVKVPENLSNLYLCLEDDTTFENDTDDYFKELKKAKEDEQK